MASQWLPDLVEPMELEERQGRYLDQSTNQQIAVSFSQDHKLDNQLCLEQVNRVSNISEIMRLRTSKQTTYRGSDTAKQSWCSPTILSFGAQDVKANEHALFYGSHVQTRKTVAIALPGIFVENVGANNNKRRYDDAMMTGDVIRKGGNDLMMSIYSQSQRDREEHILTERKKRQILSQRFIALSKIIPGLKKMDKASVLEDATKYLIQLQHKVEDLEAQTRKQTVESAAIIRKSHVLTDGCEDTENNSPCD